MKKVILVALLVAVVALISTPAFAFDLGGYTGPVSLKFTGFSQTNDNTYVAGETWAIVKLTTIEDNLTNELWGQGDNNEHIYGIIYGLTDVSVVGADPQSIQQVGGQFALYLYNDGNTTDEFLLDNPLARRNPGQADYTSITNGGSLFLSGNFTPGIIGGDFSTTVQQIFSPGSGQGSGEGYAVITGGSAMSLLKSGMILDNNGVGRDLNFNFDVSVQQAAPGWFAKIDDPVNANAVPEPMSMLLFGTGLFGLVGLRKKK